MFFFSLKFACCVAYAMPAWGFLIWVGWGMVKRQFSLRTTFLLVTYVALCIVFYRSATPVLLRAFR